MKFFKLSSAGAACALVFGVTATPVNAPVQRVGHYDFTYFTTGEQRALPVQVFDDGKSTYFQFRAGETVPAIFVNRDGRVNLAVPTFEGPYIRIQETAGRFTLQLGRAQAQVVYGGAGRENTPTIEAVNRNGMKTPYVGGGFPASENVRLLASVGAPASTMGATALETNSYATPTKGDRVTWKDSETEVSENQIFFATGVPTIGPLGKKALDELAHKARSATSITVIGRDDSSEKEGLERARANNLRDALIKMGVSPDRITVRIGVMGTAKDKLWPSDIRIERTVPTAIARPTLTPSSIESMVRSGALTKEQVIETRTPNREVPVTGFDFRATDKTISKTITRWGRSTNYEIVWDADPSIDAPVNGDAMLAASSMKEALDKVVIALQKKGYDVQATAYSNRVIRFTGGNK